MKDIELWHGDCLELMKSISDNSVDLVLTDPPYGTTKCKWDTVIDFDLMWRELIRITKKNGAMLLFNTEPFGSHLRCSNSSMFKYDWVWRKNRASNIFNAKINPLRVSENISVFFQEKAFYYPQMIDQSESTQKRNNRANNPLKNKGEQYSGSIAFGERKNKKQGYPKNVIDFNLEQNNQFVKKVFHPTQKPVALLEYLIKTYTVDGEVVLDFTMGGGSTGVACKNLNRKFIGIELDAKYFEIAEKRINEISR